ncbi:LOW QUALITY PROTEIN: mediator complex subunit 15 [Aphomia sociella]
MDNNLKNFTTMGSEDNWRTPNFRQGVVTKIEDVIQRSGMQVARNSSEMENHVFSKAKTREEYMNMVAKLILHVREMSHPKSNQGAPNMQGNQNQPGPNSQVQNQPGQGQPGSNNQSGMTTDPINALQNLASQGSRNQMMNMGPQGQMQQQGVMGPNSGMGGMQSQMGQQGPIVSQGGPQSQTATNLLQTFTQRPQMNMQMQNDGGNMGMVSNQGQMGNNMVGGMGGMGNPMGNQLQNQLAGPGMQGQMMPNMSMPNSMQVPMSGANTMGGQMPCNQVVGGMGGQMAPNAMQGQMPGQMVGGMGNSQIVGMNMLHMQNRVQNKPEVVGGMLGGYTQARAPPPNQFLRQSPSPSAPSPNMGGPSPVSMGVMGGQGTMPSPMSMGGLASCGGVGGVGGVGSPSPSAPQHLPHHVAPHQRGVGMGMVASPSSSLNTPVGAGVASPSGEEAAYKDKVRQLSKYIEPLRRMVHRMVSEGENVEKLTKMKNLLDILSNPNKRMPLETLIKCEVVLEKLDFRRGEGVGVGVPTTGKEQIFNPLLEVVNNCLQSPLSNHTLKRTFGSTLDALNGPEIKNLPPPQVIPKLEEEPPMEIPDVLQGEIARLDSRFKVSLETMQLAGGGGGGTWLVAALDDARLPCVPALHVCVPPRYPAAPPARRRRARAPYQRDHAFLERVDRAMDARCASLPKNCSVGQLLDAWEMSVRQACAPAPPPYTPAPPPYTPVPQLGL